MTKWLRRLLDIYRRDANNGREALPLPPAEAPMTRLPGTSGSGPKIRITTLSQERSQRHDNRPFDLVDLVLGAAILIIAIVVTHFWTPRTGEVPALPVNAKAPQSNSAPQLSGRAPGMAPSPIQEQRSSAQPEAPGGEDSPPVPEHIVAAVYTQEARNAGFQAKVFVIVSVDSQGMPAGVRLTTPLPFDLGDSVTEAVMQWRFRPAMKRGKHVAATTVVDVPFR